MLSHGFPGFRRKIRIIHQRKILILLLFCLAIFIFSYLNLEFCYKLLANSSLNSMCNRYKSNKYNGVLCDDICDGKSFKDFKCPDSGLKTTVFTAVRNNDIYAFKLAKYTTDPLTWRDKDGISHFPKVDDIQIRIKQNLIKEYNITVEDETIKTLLNQEIDGNNPDQISSTWRLFRDNNYVMGKLFEEEGLFPVIYGSCGPFYATEQLKMVQPETGIRRYITTDWIGRLKFAILIMDFLQRLDQVKPESLKMCKVETHDFGSSTDNRIKYRNAHYILSESGIDRLLANDRTKCNTDTDCFYQFCIGKCDEKLKICNGIQQNNNLQIVCQQIFKGNRYFPGILTTTKTPINLTSILEICSDPSKDDALQEKNRRLSPNVNVAKNLYNEIKRLYNEATFHQ